MVDEQVFQIGCCSNSALSLVKKVDWLVKETTVRAAKVSSLNKPQVTFIRLLIGVDQVDEQCKAACLHLLSDEVTVLSIEWNHISKQSRCHHPNQGVTSVAVLFE